MKQEITLTNAIVNEGASVEIAIDWNGTPHTVVFPTIEALAQNNADILTTGDEAVRWLLFYLLNTGLEASALPSAIGRKLVVDVRPAVQQTISLI